MLIILCIFIFLYNN